MDVHYSVVYNDKNWKEPKYPATRADQVNYGLPYNGILCGHI